jgi:hypothetical protein
VKGRDEELRQQEATGDDLCSMHKGLAEFLIFSVGRKNKRLRNETAWRVA